MTRIFEIASKLTDPMGVVGFALAVVLALALRRKVPRLAFAAVILAIVLVGGSFILVKVAPPPPPQYQIRVRIEDPEGRLMRLTEGVALTGAPFEKAPREGNTEWLFTVFAQQLPPNRKVLVSAEVPERSLVASEELELIASSTSVTLHMHERTLADISGTVLDRVTRKALSGATVYVVGHSEHVITTDATGGFTLPAYKPSDQPVTLHTERAGYQPDHMTYTAGRTDIAISLEPTHKKR